MTLNVLPEFTIDNTPNLRSADAILTAKRGDIGLASSVPLPEFNDLGLSQFGNTVLAPTGSPVGMGISPIPFTHSIPALGVPIERVISIGSEKKVARPDAGWGIAVVKNMHPRRDRPIVELPGNTVSPDLFSLIAIDIAIPVAVCGVDPEPTPVRLLNPFPEALKEWSRSTGISNPSIMSPDKVLTWMDQPPTPTSAIIRYHKCSILGWTVAVNASDLGMLS